MVAFARPHLYLITHSVTLDGSGAPATLEWATSFDGADTLQPTLPVPPAGGDGKAPIRWQIRKVARVGATVKEPTRVGSPLDGEIVSEGSARAAVAETPRLNVQERGFGWDPIATDIPDRHPITNAPLESGLYVLVVMNDLEPSPPDASGSPAAWNFRYNYFVVRRPAGTVKILICYPFATIAAYSGSDFATETGGSTSLYDTERGGRLRRVSLDRPFVSGQWGADKESQCIGYPFDMEQFIRKWALTNIGSGAVDVCTSFDLHRNPSLLHDGISLFISVGHDEYWSREMRENLQTFVERGGNAAFFSGNVAWWQVRFVDRVMVCFKSAVEDPLGGFLDRAVTANFCGAPTCGVEGGHGHFEENTLTGVSYRRGSQVAPTANDSDADAYVVKWDSHPLLKGVKGFAEGPAPGEDFGRGNQLFIFETDAADSLELDANGHTYAAGTDGTPTNFQVIAEADLRFTGKDPGVGRPVQAGKATMGLFTNNGTVFTVGTTNWGRVFRPDGSVTDQDVATITRNVLEALHDRDAVKPWGTSGQNLPARSYPSATWTAITTFPPGVTASAITGTIHGHLLLLIDGNFYRRDPENPSPVASSSAPTPTVSNIEGTTISCLGSDLFGQALFAGSLKGEVFVRSADINETLFSLLDWESLALPPEVRATWRTGGIAGHAKDPFVVFSVDTPPRLVFRPQGKPFVPSHVAVPGERESVLFYAPAIRTAFQRIGWVYPAIRPIASMDGNLFGVREGGHHDDASLDLYVRQASIVASGVVTAVDLVWAKIAQCPPGTYAIAAYYGRLFALAAARDGSGSTLYWRNSIPEVEFPYRPPSMLLLRRGQGGRQEFEIAQIASEGRVETTGKGSLRFDYTHVCRANAISPPLEIDDPSAPYHRLVRLTSVTGRAFFLHAPSGAGRVVTFRSYGAFEAHAVSGFIAGDNVPWDVVAHVRCGDRDSTDPSPVREKLLFYRRDGLTATGEFDENGAWRGDPVQTLTPGWTHIVGTPYGDIVFYNSTDGGLEFGRINDFGAYTPGGAVGPEHHDPDSVRGGWQHVVAVGHTYVLFHSAKSEPGSSTNALYVEVQHEVTKIFPLLLGPSHFPASVCNGLLLLHHEDGAAQVWGGRSDGLVPLREVPPAALQDRSDDILCIGVTDEHLLIRVGP